MGTVKLEGKVGDDLGLAREEDTRARGRTLVLYFAEPGYVGAVAWESFFEEAR